MNITPMVGALEQLVAQQVAIGGGDPAVEAAAQAINDTLEPAIQQIALDLAQQAAHEVAAQLPDHEVDVVLVEGEPTLRVRTIEGVDEVVAPGAYEARLTLRLTDTLKDLIEESASQAGDSVNTWVVKALSSGTRKRRQAGQRISESFEL